MWPLDPLPDQVLCTLVCEDFSHGQPDVLHLSCMVEKLFTLGGKEEGGRERETGGIAGWREGRGWGKEGGKREKRKKAGRCVEGAFYTYIHWLTTKLCYNWYELITCSKQKRLQRLVVTRANTNDYGRFVPRGWLDSTTSRLRTRYTCARAQCSIRLDRSRDI